MKQAPLVKHLCILGILLLAAQAADARRIEVTNEQKEDIGVGIGTTQASNQKDDNTLTFKSSDSKKPFVPQAELYPDGALAREYQNELVEIKKLEDMKQRAYEAQEEYEQKKVEAEKQIHAKRLYIENTKIEQEKLHTDIDAFKNDLALIEEKREKYQKELAKVEEVFQATAKEAKATRTDLERKKTNLQIAIESTANQRRSLEAKINQEQIQMGRMRADIAATEVSISRTSNDRARYEAEYNRVHGEWQELDQRLAILKVEKEQSAEELRDAQKRLAAVQRDLAEVKRNVADVKVQQQKLEQQAKVTKEKTLAELKTLDLQTAEARNLKVSYDTDVARFNSQAEKLDIELAAARDANEKARAEMENSRQIVMESHLKLENKKSDLTRMRFERERDKVNNDTFKVKVRDLASTMDSSGMVEGSTQTWVSKKVCNLRVKPDNDAESKGLMQKGRSLMVQSVGDSGFVKVMNSSGQPLYVRTSCGDFN